MVVVGVGGRVGGVCVCVCVGGGVSERVLNTHPTTNTTTSTASTHPPTHYVTTMSIRGGERARPSPAVPHVGPTLARAQHLTVWRTSEMSVELVYVHTVAYRPRNRRSVLVFSAAMDGPAVLSTPCCVRFVKISGTETRAHEATAVFGRRIVLGRAYLCLCFSRLVDFHLRPRA